MLKFNPQKRLTTEEALKHKWIKLFDQTEYDQEVVKASLKALSRFNVQQKL